MRLEVQENFLVVHWNVKLRGFLMSVAGIKMPMAGLGYMAGLSNNMDID